MGEVCTRTVNVVNEHAASVPPVEDRRILSPMQDWLSPERRRELRSGADPRNRAEERYLDGLRAFREERMAADDRRG
jgi:hypothetical protein